MSKKQCRMSKILDLINESFQDRRVPINYIVHRRGNDTAKLILNDFGVSFDIEVKNVYVHLRTGGFSLKGYTERHIVEGIEHVLAGNENVPPRNRMTYEKDTQQLLDDMGDKDYIKGVLSKHFLARAKELKCKIHNKNENSKPIGILIKQLENEVVDFNE